MRKTVILVLLIISFSAFSQEKIYLNNWQFSQAGSTQKYKATVPGTIHTDLLTNKLIPDPFYGSNEAEVYWVDSCDWIYETSFTISQEQWSRFNEINLVFEGLDTYADVFVNEEKVHSNTNMFHFTKIQLKYISDITSSSPITHLKIGSNTIKIHFRSAVNEIQKHKPHDYLILDEEPRALVRKAQYQFGWDWGPKFTTIGIWKPVYLECFDSKPQFRSLSLKQKQLTNKSATLELQTQLHVFQEKEECQLVVKEKKSGKTWLGKTIFFTTTGFSAYFRFPF